MHIRTCDNCGKICVGRWLTVRVESLLFCGPAGEFCSPACVVAEVQEYTEAEAREDAKQKAAP